MNFEPSSYFFEILRWRSLSKAAQEIGISQPALSRYLKHIEKKLGKKIYVYEDKKITLTRDGEILADYLKELGDLKQNFKDRLHQADAPLQKHINILASSGIVNFWLTEAIGEFVEQHQNICFNLTGTEGKIQIYPEIDMVIGPEIIRYDVESVFLKSYHIVLLASQKYLDRFGVPQTIVDLDHHRLITYPREGESPIGDVNWFLRVGTQNGMHRKPFLEVNSSMALLRAAKAGMGIVALGREYIDQKNTDLKIILPQVHPLRVDLYISYLKKRHSNDTIMNFKKFLIEYINKNFPFY